MKANPEAASTTAAESLVQQLTTNMPAGDLESVVSCLSDALDLAKARMHDAGGTRTHPDEPCEPDYWLG
jgi:hypothetical protein